MCESAEIGQGETIHLRQEWMDPRHIVTRAFGTPTPAALERLPMGRFWRVLPPQAQCARSKRRRRV